MRKRRILYLILSVFLMLQVPLFSLADAGIANDSTNDIGQVPLIFQEENTDNAETEMEERNETTGEEEETINEPAIGEKEKSEETEEGKAPDISTESEDSALVTIEDNLIPESETSEQGISVTESSENLMLTAKGSDYLVNVTYDEDAAIPHGSFLSVTELKDGRRYDAYMESIASRTGGAAGSIRVFDIKVMYGEKEIVIATPVQVDILLDTESENVSVIHFADKDTEGEDISSVEVDGNTVSFTAESFSAYAIVEDIESVSVDLPKISSLEELDEKGSSGLYFVSAVHYGYFCTNEPWRINATRTGIRKTKPAQAYPPADAALYYFEKVEGTTDRYYIYCMDGSERKYICNTGNNSLSLVDESNKTAFTVAINPANQQVTILGQNGFYVTMQGGESGDSFAAYKGMDDNCRFYLQYVTEIEPDSLHLNGVTYGLMNWNGGSSGKGLILDETTGELGAEGMPIMVNESDYTDQLFVTDLNDLVLWRFQYISDPVIGNLYYLITDTDEGPRYLEIGDTVRLSDVPTQNCRIQVCSGTGNHAGQIYLCSDSHVLTYSGSVDTGFTVNGSAGMEWLYFTSLVDLTDDYHMPYSAVKVSVSDPDVTTGSKLILYTRIWNPDEKRYDLYAIDYDGNMVLCYDKGDVIEWDGKQLNTLLWQFTEYTDDNGDSNGYYEFYNPYSEEYLGPKLKRNLVFSDDTVGVNLSGRKKGNYYSPILAWDERAYSYSGLKIENGRLVPCSKAEAMDFYFALLEDNPFDDSLHTVDTIDNDRYNIQMEMVNLPDRTTMSNFLGSNVGGSTFTTVPNLLSANLDENGWPTAAGGNLSTLYSGAQPVNHLFLESVYESTGYFEYDSTQNFATLKESNNGDFTVYREIATYDIDNRSTLKHGQFFPYNTIAPGVFSSVNPHNLNNISAMPLPDSDPRKYESLYLLQPNGRADTQFAMSLTASFTSPHDGLDNWGHDIMFEFTGDDDFWLYVDGRLVIDLGGIHSALGASVNFSTGEVVENGQYKLLKDIFYQNYLNEGHTSEEADAFIDSVFVLNEEGDWVFKDYSRHQMRIFYMERGGGASNLHMKFNLSSVKKGAMELEKVLTNVADPEDAMIRYPYQILYKLEGDDREYYLSNKTADVPAENTDYVFYSGTHNPVAYQSSGYHVDDIFYDHVFFLKPGETAEVNFPENTSVYRVVECGVRNDLYQEVYANGEAIKNDSMIAGDNRKDVGIDYDTTDDRSRVTYVNEVDRDCLHTMVITKELYDETGTHRVYDDSALFNFRLYFKGEGEESFVAANMYPYYVKNENNEYCLWDMDTQGFVSTGKTSFEELTAAEQSDGMFHTSINGAISKIPSWYTIELRDLFPGTEFKVVERKSEMPDGYTFLQYDADSNVVTNQDAGIVDRVEEDGAVDVDICNKKGWGLRLHKVWSDSEYVTNRDSAYFAIYVNDNGEQLVPGTVRKLEYGENSLYWYFADLPINVPFSEYHIREVVPVNPTETDEGVISYDSLSVLEDGQSQILNVCGVSEHGMFPAVYVVQYEDEISNTDNVRTERITNNREGLRIRKVSEDGQPLQDAVFSVSTDSGSLIERCISDENGFVTDVFFSSDTDYIMVELRSPHGYVSLEEPFQLHRNNDGTIRVSGLDPSLYTLTEENGIQVLSLKNPKLYFTAVKTDGETNQPLAGVRFALFKEYTVGNVTSVDTHPMPGYEELVTGVNGVIPKIDATLLPGTYELRELEPPDGYKPLVGRILFTVTETGRIVKKHFPQDVHLVQTGNSYVLSIMNQKEEMLTDLSVEKTVTGNMGNKTNRFSFWIVLNDSSFSSEVSAFRNNVEEQISFTQGRANVFLSHGDCLRITGLPVGVSYQVTEDTVFGYHVESTGASGILSEGENAVSFVNRRNVSIPTSRKVQGLFVLGFLVLFACFLWYVRKKFRLMR